MGSDGAHRVLVVAVHLKLGGTFGMILFFDGGGKKRPVFTSWSRT